MGDDRALYDAGAAAEAAGRIADLAGEMGLSLLELYGAARAVSAACAAAMASNAGAAAEAGPPGGEG